MTLGTTRQEAEQKLAVRLSPQHFGQHGWCLVIANDQVIARSGVEDDTSVPKVAVHDPRLVLLVVIHP